MNDAEAHRAKWGYKSEQPGASLTLALDVGSVLHPSIVRGRGGRGGGDGASPERHSPLPWMWEACRTPA